MNYKLNLIMDEELSFEKDMQNIELKSENKNSLDRSI
jgi:hypothetical protein